jgi:nucleoside-diphosphate-sugar epimerase
MKIFLTGGAGDLGVLLGRDLEQQGDLPVRMDIRLPANPQRGQVVQGSILDRRLLAESMAGADCVVHIAAWHGIHLVTGQKNVYDFWDLNVTGTFNVFQAAVEAGISKVIYLSSTSQGDRFGIYGHTKVLGEEIALNYRRRHNLDVIVLRPSAFIPWWNRAVYASFEGWAQWYWKGAVHIDDVEQAVLKSLALLKAGPLDSMPTLYLDGKYEYTPAELAQWDSDGPGTTFTRHYAAYAEEARRHGLDPALRPEVFDIEPTRQYLGYAPRYSFLNLLQDLAQYGAGEPPEPVL